MPMIRRADAGAVARDAVVLDLGDLARQGRELADRARREADRIVEEAQAERERLISGAFEEGHARGLTEGRAEGHAEGLERGRLEAIAAEAEALAALEAAWRAALDGLEAMRGELRAEAERGVLTLAVRLGERVAKRAIELDGEAAARQLAEAIELAMRPSRVRIRVSPSDVHSVRSALPGLADRLAEGSSATIMEDASLTHGSVVVETDESRIDATIETQLARIVGVLLPGELS
jgi:flagellar biosynthesis/type III secretory pathway protein FliH